MEWHVFLGFHPRSTTSTPSRAEKHAIPTDATGSAKRIKYVDGKTDRKGCTDGEEPYAAERLDSQGVIVTSAV